MNINGMYGISIEMSARKTVQGLVATTQRLLGHVGVQGMPEPPDMEEQIRRVVENYKQAHQVLDAFSMTIDDGSITVKTDEGELAYQIERKTEKDDNHVLLKLQSKEMGPSTWDVALCGEYLMFESDDSLSEWVFERK